MKNIVVTALLASTCWLAGSAEAALLPRDITGDGVADDIHKPCSAVTGTGIPKEFGGVSRAGIESTGAKPGDYIGAGGLEISPASHVCKTGQYCQWAATGEQRH